MFAKRLKRARKAAGLSMASLGQEIGVSHNAIKKYERGENMPSSENLFKLSKALGVRSEYFFRPTKVKLSGIEYRKRASTPQKTLNRINGDVLDQAERWAELLEFYPDSVRPVPQFKLPENLPQNVSTAEEIELVADQMRADLYKQLIYRALGEGYIGESKAAELLKMSLTRFHKERKLGAVNAGTN